LKNLLVESSVNSVIKACSRIISGSEGFMLLAPHVAAQRFEQMLEQIFGQIFHWFSSG
jgi:hypothetical protein